MKGKYEIGFIGAGNMCQAMVSGIYKAEIYDMKRIIICDIDKKKLENLNGLFSIDITENVNELVKNTDIIILTVKPDIYDVILDEIKNSFHRDKIIVTVAAGKTIKSVEDILGENSKIFRTMPNTPALVNQGMTGICPNANVNDSEISIIKKIFQSFGKVEIVPEKLMEAVIGVSGSAPAYVFMFIEALADAGVLHGLSREQAYRFASQAVLGSAQMVLETGKHPAELKDMVCSPGGTTIEAVVMLEKSGFRSAIIESVNICVEKANVMKTN